LSLIFPENAHLGECGCYNCQKLWIPPRLIKLQEEFPLAARGPGRCISSTSCGKNLAIPGCDGIFRKVPFIQKNFPKMSASSKKLASKNRKAKLK
jgi:hypothetical protein